MLIIEGCDQAGKTTLARECVKELVRRGLPMMYGHLDKPPQSWDKYWSYRELVCRHVVMDRFHMSHLAYRAVDREPHDLTPLKYAMVDAEITLKGGLVVVLLPTNTFISRRFETKNRDEMYSHEHVLKVNEVFHDIAAIHEPWNGYTVKADIVLHDKDLATQNFASTVDCICKRYKQQQTEHDLIHKWRPAGHA